MATAKRVHQAHKAAKAARAGKSPSPNPGGVNRHISTVLPGTPNILPSGVVLPKKPKRTVAQKATVKRGAALGDTVPCCVAEAVAASLRLTGWRVTEEDVLRLHSLAAGRSGAEIEDILDAVVSHGLAGVRPAEVKETPAPGPGSPGLILGIDVPGPHTVFDDGGSWWSWGQQYEPFPRAVISEAWSIRW